MVLEFVLGVGAAYLYYGYRDWLEIEEIQKSRDIQAILEYKLTDARQKLEAREKCVGSKRDAAATSTFLHGQ